MVLPISSDIVISDTSPSTQSFRHRREILLQCSIGEERTRMCFTVSTTFGQSNRIGVAVPRSIAAPQATFCLDREGSGGHRIDLTPEVITGQTGTGCLQEHTVKIYRQQRRGGQIYVEVGTQVTFLVLILGTVTIIEIGILDKSGIVDQISLGIVAQATASSTEAQREDVTGTMVTESLCYPVYVREIIRILATLERAERIGIVAWCEAIIGISLIESQCIVISIDKLWTASFPVEGVIVCEFDLVTVVLASFGDDIDGTVSAFVTIERSSWRVFQHRDALHLFG